MFLPSLASAPRDPCALETLARLPRAEAFYSLGPEPRPLHGPRTRSSRPSH